MAKKEKERRIIQEATGDGKGVTIWFELDRLAKVDEICAAVNCSRSWLIGQIIDSFDLQSFIDAHRSANSENEGANSNEKQDAGTGR